MAFSRIAATPKDAFDVQLGGEHFVQEGKSGLVLEVALINGVSASMLPQVHVAVVGETNHVAIVTADVSSLDRLHAFVTKKIESGQLRAMHVKLGPEAAGPTARLVMHRERDGFIRAQTDADARNAIEVLEKDWASAYKHHVALITAGNQQAEVQSIPQPSVRVNLEIRPDDVNRAVAKIAFNVLAARVSPEFALSPEFDELRKYVLGEDIRHRSDLGQDEVAVDLRFVTQLPHDTAPLVPTEEHAVTISYVHPSLFAWVTLYRTDNFVVRFGDISLSENVLAVHEFSSVRTGNAALDVAETIQRMTAQVEHHGK
ncbi:hypothetical protein [Corallococcus macrosporus]|uniref:hypothetical protein n=1 Tax=Corallococcus macrosporus TaxID=35 RepID=UPI001EFE9743|nr:hypothetical protein [Corallococcus macrosporus]